MKTTFLLVFFLLWGIGLNAQKLEYEKTDSYVVVKNENFVLLLKPYKDRGPATQYWEKSSKRRKDWYQKIKNGIVSESVNEKMIAVRGYISFTLYFDRDGKIIDVTLQMPLGMYEKLTEEGIYYIYTQLMKTSMDIENLEWNGDFNYSYYINLLTPTLPGK